MNIGGRFTPSCNNTDYFEWSYEPSTIHLEEIRSELTEFSLHWVFVIICTIHKGLEFFTILNTKGPNPWNVTVQCLTKLNVMGMMRGCGRHHRGWPGQWSDGVLVKCEGSELNVCIGSLVSTFIISDTQVQPGEVRGLGTKISSQGWFLDWRLSFRPPVEGRFPVKVIYSAVFTQNVVMKRDVKLRLLRCKVWLIYIKACTSNVEK